MRILVNALTVHGPRSGIGHYTAELLRCLQGQLAPEESLQPRPGTWFGGLRRSIPRPSLPAASGKGSGLKSRLAARLKPMWRGVLRCYLQAVAWVGRFDLYHEPNFIPVPTAVPTVATVHDLSVLLHPEWHPAERVAWFRRGLRRLLDQCVHFFAISESARQEIVRTLGIPAARITRTYMGVRPWLRPMSEEQVAPVLRSLGLPPRYLLYVGTIEPRKNVLTLLRAYCDLPAPLRQAYPLVLAGGWGWKADAVASFFEDEARHQGVMRLGYVPEEALGALYNGARALVFPSLYEGFGLPPVEMLACGGAVLASTAAAVAEVAGGPACLIDPQDQAGWRDALKRVLTDDEWWQQLRRHAVAHASAFTWEQCAADSLRVYREIAAGRYDCAPTEDKRQAA
jgi:alpha-1,3-rhamnosyl/mannosyltransferase